MFALDRPNRAMGLDRRPAEQRVEMETGEGARMRAGAQIALGHAGLAEERNCGGGDSRDDGKHRDLRTQPGDGQRRDEEFQTDSRKPQAKAWQRAERMKRVAAFEHVRDRPTLEIRIREPRDLVEKHRAQTAFEVAAHAPFSGGQNELHA